MASLKQIKKKVKSIRQFVKAFTTSSRSSRKEAKRWKEENSRLIQEEHSEQKVTSSPQVHEEERCAARSETGSSEPNNARVIPQVESSALLQTSPACQKSPAVEQFLNVNLWAPELRPTRSSSYCNELATDDPFIGHDPFSLANVETESFSHCVERDVLASNNPFSLVQDPFSPVNNTGSLHEENWAFFGESMDNPLTTKVSETDCEPGSSLLCDERVVVATTDPFVGHDQFSTANNTGYEECTAFDLQQDNSDKEEFTPSDSVECMAVSSGDDTVVTIASIKEVVDMPEDEIISSNRSFEEPIADTSSADMRGNELISESSPVDTDTSYSKDLDTRNCAASGEVIDPFTSTTTEGGSNEPANAGIAKFWKWVDKQVDAEQIANNKSSANSSDSTQTAPATVDCQDESANTAESHTCTENSPSTQIAKDEESSVYSSPSTEIIKEISTHTSTCEQVVKHENVAVSLLPTVVTKCSTHEDSTSILNYCNYNELSEDDLKITVLSQKIILESCIYSKTKDSMLGYIGVANLSYHKKVFARVSSDSWESFTDVSATYLSSSEAIDRFTFELPCKTEGQGCIESAVCMETSGRCFWDNNNGRNHVLKIKQQ